MIKDRPILFFFITAILFIGTNALFQIFIYGHQNYNSLLLQSFKNKKYFNYTFWLSSYGIGLKVMIDITITCFLFKISSIVFKYKIDLGKIILIVCTAYFSFFIQMCSEFFYIESTGTKNVHVENLSLFSLSFIFDLFALEIPFYMKYLYETINIFEISFILLLIYLFKKITDNSYGKATMLILVSYVLPLMIWLLVITLITLINNN